MSPDAIRIATIGLAVLVLVAYGLFIRWRIRVHRARREADELQRMNHDTRSAAAMFQQESARPTSGTGDSSTGDSPSFAGDTPTVASDTQQISTVIEAVAGITLPHDLVPHPDATPRLDAADRVAFITDHRPAEQLREGMEDALVALGYQLIWSGDEGLARRGDIELRVDVYDAPHDELVGNLPAFPVAPPGTAIVDLWLPAV